ncbi:MAG: hypothetical protein Harvfovirus18_10 [Harvfovirus sp.]|uniref:Uncharacterized protein n=1 Tax=Harvfovirus sp. TaxID=2487768 RepID=A0A3G5A1S4_9VIRU|nr:MAG: hypothetical protein Harvfovirus18_10 [Harvfovirus sp.]
MTDCVSVKVCRKSCFSSDAKNVDLYKKHLLDSGEKVHRVSCLFTNIECLNYDPGKLDMIRAWCSRAETPNNNLHITIENFVIYLSSGKFKKETSMWSAFELLLEFVSDITSDNLHSVTSLFKNAAIKNWVFLSMIEKIDF